MRYRPTKALHAAACLAALSALAGCSQGLFDREEALKKLPPERLRDIDRVSLDGYRKPAAAPTAPISAVADAKAALDAVKSRFEAGETVKIDLERCRMSALTNNLDLKVARVDPAIQSEVVSAEEAKFNSAFTLSTSYADQNQPTSSTLNSAKSKNTHIAPGVRIPLRTGGTATVTLPWNKSENNNAFSTLNPAYTSDLFLSISQPLLRGAGRRANTASIHIATYNQQASEARTKLEVIRQLAGVDRSYWRLYQARKQLEVRQQQYELASEQLGRAERRVRSQVSAEVEVIRAQGGVADQLEQIILAQNDVLTQQRELKRIINEPGLPIEAQTLVEPETPPDPVEYGFDRAELVQQALANRMEMLELELQLSADAAQIAFNKNQSLPLLSLDYSYRINGLGASSQDSFRQLHDADFRDWSLGLTAEIPFDNEQARARVRQAILTRLQRLASKEARTLSITQEVLAAIDQIDASWQRILASNQSVTLNIRTLAAEQRQFDVGKSTSTNVLDASTRLADAKLAEIRAIADYQIAQIDLAFATGTLLGSSKVSFEPTPSPDASQPAPPEQP
ncbi:MAG: TolC family protein [Planctomycetota bacterium]